MFYTACLPWIMNRNRLMIFTCIIVMNSKYGTVLVYWEYSVYMYICKWLWYLTFLICCLIICVTLGGYFMIRSCKVSKARDKLFYIALEYQNYLAPLKFVTSDRPRSCKGRISTDRSRSLLAHIFVSLQWRHNACDGVSNHQPHDCLLKRLFKRRSKKTSKLRVTGLFAGIHWGPVQPKAAIYKVTTDVKWL